MFKTNARPTIDAFLLTLYFSKALTSREIYPILNTEVKNPTYFLGKALFDGYLIKDDSNYKLTKKGLNKAINLSYNLEHNQKKGTTNSDHTNQLLKSLFVLLKHLEIDNIQSIRKEKKLNNAIQPDLTIQTNSKTLLIEIDTGTQGLQVIKSKINRYKAIMNEEDDFLIFFTKSKKTYNEYKENQTAKFILILPEANISAQFLALNMELNNNLNISKNTFTITGQSDISPADRVPVMANQENSILTDIYKEKFDEVARLFGG